MSKLLKIIGAFSLAVGVTTLAQADTYTYVDGYKVRNADFLVCMNDYYQPCRAACTLSEDRNCGEFCRQQAERSCKSQHIQRTWRFNSWD